MADQVSQDQTTDQPPDDYSIYQRAGKAWDVDPDILPALRHGERSYENPTAVSGAGAQGPFQLMPQIQRAYGVTDPNDLEQSAFAAARLMRENLDRYGNYDDAIKAYNGSPAVWNTPGVQKYLSDVKDYHGFLKAARPSDQPPAQTPDQPTDTGPEKYSWDWLNQQFGALREQKKSDSDIADMLTASKTYGPIVAEARAKGLSGDQIFKDHFGLSDWAPSQGEASAVGSGLLQSVAEGEAGLIEGTGLAAHRASQVAHENAQSVGSLNTQVMDAIDSGASTSDLAEKGLLVPFARSYAAASPDERKDMRASLEQGMKKAVPDTTPTEDLPTSKYAKELREATQQAAPVDPDREKDFLVKTARIAGGLPVYAVAGMVAGVPGMAGVMGAQNYGDTFRAAKAKGATDDDAYEAAFLSGISGTVLGGLPMGVVMHAIPAAFKEQVLGGLVDAGKSGVVMTSLSQLQQFVDNVIAQNTFDPKRPLTQGLGENLGEQFVAGAAGPAIATAAGAAGRRVAGKPTESTAPTSETPPTTEATPPPAAPSGGEADAPEPVPPKPTAGTGEVPIREPEAVQPASRETMPAAAHYDPETGTYGVIQGGQVTRTGLASIVDAEQAARDLNSLSTEVATEPARTEAEAEPNKPENFIEPGTPVNLEHRGEDVTGTVSHAYMVGDQPHARVVDDNGERIYEGPQSALDPVAERPQLSPAIAPEANAEVPITAPAPSAPAIQPPDISAVARHIDPATFAQVDSLTQRQDTLRRWLDELEGPRQARAEQIAQPIQDQIDTHQTEIDRLQGLIADQDTTQRNAKKYQARLPDLQAKVDDLTGQRDAIVQDASTGDSPDMTKVRSELQKIDFGLRDLAPQVAAATEAARTRLASTESFPATVDTGSDEIPFQRPAPTAESRSAKIWSTAVGKLTDPAAIADHPATKIAFEDDVPLVRELAQMAVRNPDGMSIPDRILDLRQKVYSGIAKGAGIPDDVNLRGRVGQAVKATGLSTKQIWQRFHWEKTGHAFKGETPETYPSDLRRIREALGSEEVPPVASGGAKIGRQVGADSDRRLGRASGVALQRPILATRDGRTENIAKPFYSALERAVESGPVKAYPPVWKAYIKNASAKGVKQAEVDWTGINDFLDAAKGPVSKAEVLDHLRSNGVELHEVTKGENFNENNLRPDARAVADHKDEWGRLSSELDELEVAEKEAHYGGDILRSSDLQHEMGRVGQERETLHAKMIAETKARTGVSGPTKYHQWQLPGGENYKEMLLTLTPREMSVEYGAPQPFNGDGRAMLEGRHLVEGVTETPWMAGDQEGRITHWPKTYNWKGEEQPGKYIINSRDIQNARFDTLAEAKAAIEGAARPEGGRSGNALHKTRSDIYRSAHWEEPNVLAHVRMSDRTDAAGRKLLHVEEIQSDWHQAGRKRGYREEQERNLADLMARRDALEPGTQRNEIQDQINDLGRAAPGVPDAPFKKTWHELLLKKLLHKAAAEGYDGLSWTPGADQAARYDLSKHIKEVVWRRSGTSGFTPMHEIEREYPDLPTRGILTAMDHNGHTVIDRSMTKDEVPDYIGKDVAERLLAQEPKLGVIGGTAETRRTLSGLDLKVGGEGMKGFYDKIVPDFLNRYGKRWGAKVGETKIDAGLPAGSEIRRTNDGMWTIRDPHTGQKEGLWDTEAEARRWLDENGGGKGAPAKTVPSIDITPAMRKSVMEEGQPLFRRPDIRATPLDPTPAKTRILVTQVDALAKRLASGATTKGFERITESGDTVHGAYIPPRLSGIGHLIAWSMESPNAIRTVRHEAVHYLRRSGLIRPEEWAKLDQAAREGDWIGKYDIEKRYPDLSDDQKIEEAVAEHFGDWRQNNTHVPGWMQPVYRRVRAFLDQVGDRVRRILGKDVTAQDVRSRMESGEVGKRAGVEETRSRRAAFQADVPTDLTAELHAHAAGSSDIHEATKSWLLKREKDTGHESAAVIEPHRGEVVSASTSHKSKDVYLTKSATEEMRNPQNDLVIHHNHTAETGISAGDIRILAFAGVHSVVAHTPGGRSAGVTLSPVLRNMADKAHMFVANILDRAHYTASGAVSLRLLGLEHAGIISARDGDLAISDLTARAMDAAGFIHYAGLPHTTFSETLAREIISEASAAIAPKDKGALNAASGINHATRTVFSDRGDSILHPRVREGALRDRSGSEGDGRRSETQPDDADSLQQSTWSRRPEGGGIDATANLDHATRTVFADREAEILHPPLRDGAGFQRPGRDRRSRASAPIPREENTAGRPEDESGGVAFDRPRYPEQPTNIPEGKDYIDNLSHAMAEHLQGMAPGTYARRLREMSPLTGPARFKGMDVLNVQKVSAFPFTIAQLDTHSGAFWAHWKAREGSQNTLMDRGRSFIAKTFLKIPDNARDRVYAAHELDRIYQTDRTPQDPMVYENTSAPYARASKIGDRFTLTPEEKKAYFELKTKYSDDWSNVMKGTARKMGYPGHLGDDWGANINQMIHDAQTANHPALAKQYGRAADMMVAMEQQRRRAYQPLMRFGNYYASVTPRHGSKAASKMAWDGDGFPPVQWFSTAEQSSQNWMGKLTGAFGKTHIQGTVPEWAAEHVKEVREKFPASEGWQIDHGFLFNKPDVLRKLDIPAVEKLLMLMEGGVKRELRDNAKGMDITKEGAKELVQGEWDRLYDSLLDTFRDQMYGQIKAGFKKQARVVPGYSGDWDRVTGAYMHGIARHVADLLHGDDIRQAYDAIQDSPEVHPHVKQYWDDWQRYNTTHGGLMSKVSADAAHMAFLYTMAGNPSSSAIFALHTPIMVHSALIPGVGAKESGAALYGALGENYRHIKADTTRGLYVDLPAIGKTATEKAMISRAMREGKIHSVSADDMAALNDRQAALLGRGLKGDIRRVMNVAASNISVIDQVNRASTLLAAYRLYKKPGNLAKMADAWKDNQVFRAMVEQEGLTPETAARFMLSRAAGEWGKANQAPMMRGTLGNSFFLLHGFVTRVLSHLWNLSTKMGAPGKQAFGWAMAGMMLGAGAEGLPFAQDAENLVDHITKWITGKDPMLSYRIRSMLADAGLGKVGAEMVMRGPMSQLLGVDLASRIGLGDPVTRMFSSADLVGTLPSIIVGRYKAMHNRIESGQSWQAIAGEALPAAVRNPLRAAAEAKEGLRVGKKGTTTMGADKIPAVDLAKQALGFRPLDQARQYEKGDFDYRAKRAKMAPPRNPIP